MRINVVALWSKARLSVMMRKKEKASKGRETPLAWSDSSST